MWLLIAFLVVPLIEITLFIQVGGLIGLWWTLATVVVTALLGTYLVRSQGIATLNQLQSSLGQGHDPTEPLVHGAMILFAGALLLTPGFFTDAVGFALMVPHFRMTLFTLLKARIKLQTFSAQAAPHDRSTARGTVIDGEFEEIVIDESQPPGDSGWTKH